MPRKVKRQKPKELNFRFPGLRSLPFDDWNMGHIEWDDKREIDSREKIIGNPLAWIKNAHTREAYKNSEVNGSYNGFYTLPGGTLPLIYTKTNPCIYHLTLKQKTYKKTH